MMNVLISEQYTKYGNINILWTFKVFKAMCWVTFENKLISDFWFLKKTDFELKF